MPSQANYPRKRIVFLNVDAWIRKYHTRDLFFPVVGRGFELFQYPVEIYYYMNLPPSLIYSFNFLGEMLEVVKVSMEKINFKVILYPKLLTSSNIQHIFYNVIVIWYLFILNMLKADLPFETIFVPKFTSFSLPKAQ